MNQWFHSKHGWKHGWRSCLCLLMIVVQAACQPIQRSPAGSAATTTSATTDNEVSSETYQDPTGLFSVPIPTNWTATPGEGFVRLSDPENKLKVYVLTVAAPSGDLAAAIATGWARVDPTFALAQADSIEPPATDGKEKILGILYDAPKERIVQARAALYHGVAYLLLFDGELAALQKREAQLTIIKSGLTILAIQQNDLSQVAPLPVDQRITDELTAFIETWQQRFQIPGVAVAIVEKGKVVYSRGFGVRNPAGEPLTPQTYMMFGSTGKGLTTLLMATLVDAGKMSWDTPAVAIYPQFAVKDPALSKTITMRNLVCACTGVARRDLEFIFNARQLHAEDVIASLRDFEFFTGFGEAFQYSNQMVAAAGYIAGVADGGRQDDLLAGYLAALQQRVLDPLAMTRTTASFATVLADANYATPYAYNYQNQYIAIAPEMETILSPLVPAGALWSTLDDLSKYMIMQLSEGVAANGKRVVSRQNLAELRKPQIKVSDEMSYGLGWGIGNYKGQPLIEHPGNTVGFSSEFKFLPAAQVGIIVLSNAENTNPFSSAVSERLFELLFQQQPEVEKRLDFYHQQLASEAQTVSAQVVALDQAAVAPYLGDYHSDVLGEMKITLNEGVLRADVGEFSGVLLPKNDANGKFEGYLFSEPPMNGLVLHFDKDAQGQPLIVIGEGASQYSFGRVQ